MNNSSISDKASFILRRKHKEDYIKKYVIAVIFTNRFVLSALIYLVNKFTW